MKCSIGQDSHKFDVKGNKPLILGGVIIPNHIPFKANSDGDVILHAITNAISGITSVNILGEIADDMCKNKNITNSDEYLKEALKYLNEYTISHISISIECSTPHLAKHIQSIKFNIANLLSIKIEDVGLTATSGEGLTSFGKGEGVMCLCILTVK